MKWSSILLALMAISLSAVETSAVQGRGPQPVTIGVVNDGPYLRLTRIHELFRTEIVQLLAGEFEPSFPAAKRIEGDWTLASIESALDRLLADPEVDIVLALGPVSSHVVAHRTNLPKPVVAPIIISAELQQLPHDGRGSGVRNLNYVALPERQDIPIFLEVAPFSRVAVLTNTAVYDALPDLIDTIDEVAREMGVEAEIIPVASPIDDALAQLSQGFDAAYVLPLMQVSEAEFDRLVETLIELRLPSFSWMGQIEVERGIMVGRTPAEFPERLARRTALNVQRILLGEDAGTLPVAFSAQDRLTINMATARAIGVYPKWKTMTEALLVSDDQRPADRTVNLEGAVRDAVIANLDLAARDRGVAAGAQNISLATADLWPQLQVSADGSIIDEDRATVSFGRQPERLFTGSASLNWLLYSEPVWANRSVQKSAQEARVQNRESVRLDIAFAASVTYLNVLRAKTFERIQKENLEVTRTNLELAQVRESIGQASPGEVYRWQTQIANNRQAVIDASRDRNLAEIELNRLLNRPLEEPFNTEEAELRDPELLSSQDRIYAYIDNPWSFRVFRQFMAQEAFLYSPELGALTALTAAQRRALSSTKRSFWQPTLAVQAGVTDVLSTGGAGSDVDFGDSGLVGLKPGDINWTVGFSLSYPLFVGGARVAERNRAAERLARLEVELDATAQRVEQRVRFALHEMGASLASIDLSRDAADAAGNNFQLVSDAYARGAVSIIDLLDAQNAALVSDEQAANAVYNFLIDLMKVERAAGRFRFFLSDQEREEFFERLNAFFEQAGAPAPRR